MSLKKCKIRRTMFTASLLSDAVDVLRDTIPKGARSDLINALLIGDLARINEAKLAVAKTDMERAKIGANLSKLKRSAESLKEALKQKNSPMAKARRLILVGEQYE